MKKILQRSLAALGVLAAILFLPSCELDTLNDLGWKPEILGPIVNSNVNYLDFEELINSQKDYEITVGNFTDNIPDVELDTVIGGNPVTLTFEVEAGVEVPFLPAFGPLDDFPGDYLNLFQYAKSVSVDTLSATISINNVLPVPIGAGTRVVIRDSSNTSNVVLDHSIQEDVPVDSTYDIAITLSNIEVSTTLELFVTDFQSPGSSEPVTFSNEDLVVTITVNLLDLDEARLVPELEYVLQDTVDFDFQEIDSSEYAAYDGFLYMWMTNSFPADIEVQMIVLDANLNPVLTFFEEEDNSSFLLPAGEVDQTTGEVLTTSESGKTQLLDIQADLPLLNQGEKLAVIATLSTDTAPPDCYVMTETSTLSVLITADVAIDPSQIQTTE